MYTDDERIKKDINLLEKRFLKKLNKEREISLPGDRYLEQLKIAKGKISECWFEFEKYLAMGF